MWARRGVWCSLTGRVTSRGDCLESCVQIRVRCTRCIYFETSSPLLIMREREHTGRSRFSHRCHLFYVLGSDEEGGAPAARHQPKHSNVLLS